MTQVTRARQRTALATLLAGVTGVDQAFTYPPDADTPDLVGQCYGMVGTYKAHMKNRAGSKQGVYMQQEVMWAITLVRRSAPLGAQDNTGRQAAMDSFDTILDAVEYALYTAANLHDGGGVVAENFGNDIQTLVNATDFGEDRTVQMAAVIVNGWTIQT